MGYSFGIFAGLLNLILNLLLGLLSVLPPLLAAAVLILAAVKWDKKHADFIFCGVAAAGVLRLLHLILVFPVTLLRGVFVYHTVLHLSAQYITTSLLHVLGYVLAAGVVFGLMYLMGCAPVMGKTAEQVKENLRSSAADVFGTLKKTAGEVSAKAAPAAAPAAAATSAAPTPAAYRRRMSTNRGLLMYILLNIVTCGIYSYIFIYSLSNDVNEVCQGDGEKTGGLLAYILLNLVTCNIYYFIWWYKLGNRIAANGPRYNVTIQENGTSFLLWTLLGSLLCGIGPLIALHQVLRNMNTLCAAYNYKNGFTA